MTPTTFGAPYTIPQYIAKGNRRARHAYLFDRIRRAARAAAAALAIVVVMALMGGAIAYVDHIATTSIAAAEHSARR